MYRLAAPRALLLVLVLPLLAACGGWGGGQNPLYLPGRTGAEVRGAIRAGALGVAGARVTLANDNLVTIGVTDVQGNYLFTDVPPGQYRLTYGKWGYAFPAPGRTDVTVGGANVTVAAVSCAPVSASSWRWRNPLPQGNRLAAVAGNDAGRIVAVGAGGTVLTSTDGITWTHRPIPDVRDLNAVAYGNGKFVAVGEGGTIAYSTDGINWTDSSTSYADSIRGIVFGDNTFLAIGLDGMYLASRDGIEWALGRLPVTGSLTAVAYGNGTFFAASDGGDYAKTDDVWSGWLMAFRKFGQSIRGAAYGNGTFVLTGDGGTILTSSDGDTWIRQDSETTHDLGPAAYGNGRFVVVDRDASAGGSVLFSGIGPSYWYSHDPGVDAPLSGVGFCGGRFIAMGDSGTLLESFSGSTWTPVTARTADDLSDVLFADGQFVAVGADLAVLTSPDGWIWTSRSLVQGAATLRSAAHGNGTFVAVGDSGTVLASPDAVAWTPVPSGFPGGLWAVAYGNGTFVAVGDNGTVLTSPDGSAWTARSSGTTATLRGVAYGNGLFVAAGAMNGIVLTSPDGIAWSQRFTGMAFPSLGGVSFAGDRFWVAVEGGTILRSSNGIAWSSGAYPWGGGLDRPSRFASNDNTTVAVGSGGTVGTTVDGQTWTRRNPAGTEDLRGVAFGDNTFVAVGARGVILQSPAGWF